MTRLALVLLAAALCAADASAACRPFGHRRARTTVRTTVRATPAPAVAPAPLPPPAPAPKAAPKTAPAVAVTLTGGCAGGQCQSATRGRVFFRTR